MKLSKYLIILFILVNTSVLSSYYILIPPSANEVFVDNKLFIFRSWALHMKEKYYLFKVKWEELFYSMPKERVDLTKQLLSLYDEVVKEKNNIYDLDLDDNVCLGIIHCFIRKGLRIKKIDEIRLSNFQDNLILMKNYQQLPIVQVIGKEIYLLWDDINRFPQFTNLVMEDLSDGIFLPDFKASMAISIAQNRTVKSL